MFSLRTMIKKQPTQVVWEDCFFTSANFSTLYHPFSPSLFSHIAITSPFLTYSRWFFIIICFSFLLQFHQHYHDFSILRTMRFLSLLHHCDFIFFHFSPIQTDRWTTVVCTPTFFSVKFKKELSIRLFNNTLFLTQILHRLLIVSRHLCS